jgi:hypothetical protein
LLAEFKRPGMNFELIFFVHVVSSNLLDVCYSTEQLFWIDNLFLINMRSLNLIMWSQCLAAHNSGSIPGLTDKESNISDPWNQLYLLMQMVSSQLQWKFGRTLLGDK